MSGLCKCLVCFLVEVLVANSAIKQKTAINVTVAEGRIKMNESFTLQYAWIIYCLMGKRFNFMTSCYIRLLSLNSPPPEMQREDDAT